MDSKKQDDKSGVLKFLLSFILLVNTIIIIIGIDSYNNNNSCCSKSINYESGFYCNNKNYETEIVNVFSNNIYDDVNVENNNVQNITLLSGKKNNVDNIFRTFDIKVNGFEITVNDNTFGYVDTEEDRNLILKDICEAYIAELGIDTKNVPQIQITGKLEATPNKVKISQLSTRNEIAEEIYKYTVANDNLLGLELSVEYKTEEEIEPPIVIDYDEELYMGESVRLEGESGSKLVYKELTYEGLEKVDETIINEETIIDAKPTVIKKGVKNPYEYGVAFLSRPTSGGYLSSAYGEERWNSYHKGIDIAEDLGEAVTAAFEGTVVFAGFNDGGYGNLVIIEHANNITTYYAHLNEVLVDCGDEISLNEVIGTIGSTGYSTGPHLHFEMRVNGEPVNPLDYIKE